MLHVETSKESYCPDFYSRKTAKTEKENLEQTINRWIAQKQMSLSELNNIISHYKNSKQKGK